MSFRTHILYKDGVLMIYGPHTSRNDSALPLLYLENMTRASRSNGGLIRRLFLRSSSLTFQFLKKKKKKTGSSFLEGLFGVLVWFQGSESGFQFFLFKELVEQRNMGCYNVRAAQVQL